MKILRAIKAAWRKWDPRQKWCHCYDLKGTNLLTDILGHVCQRCARKVWWLS